VSAAKHGGGDTDHKQYKSGYHMSIWNSVLIFSNLEFCIDIQTDTESFVVLLYDFSNSHVPNWVVNVIHCPYLPYLNICSMLLKN
jgi:hypothetical protein